MEQAELSLEFTRITSPIDGIASIARAQIGDLVGPATGELTTVSTVDPIKVYYNVTEQAYITFTRQFTTENDRYGRLRQLEIDLILTDGTVYPLKGKIYAADRQIGLTTGARCESKPSFPTRATRFAQGSLRECGSNWISNATLCLFLSGQCRNYKATSRWRWLNPTTKFISNR